MEETIEKQDAKKQVGKKFWSIAMLCVAGVIVLGMILCYFIPKNFAPQLPEASYIKVYSSTQDGVVYNKESETYKKVMNLNGESFKVTIMDALLHGELSNGGEYVEKTQSNPKSLGSYSIELFYDEVQHLNRNVSYKDYLSVLIVVENTTDLAETKVYFMNTSTVSRVQFKTMAHQSALYEYVKSL